MTMGGSIAQPSWVSNGCNVASMRTTSLQYVSLNNCTLRFGFGGRVGWMLEGLLGCTLYMVLIVPSISIFKGSMCMGVTRRVM